MASTCARADLDWLLGKIPSFESEALEWTVRGSGEVAVPGGV